MAVHVESPRRRPELREPSRYPGLTLEERGLDFAPTVLLSSPEPPQPWLIPSEGPHDARSEGPAGAIPERVLPGPPEQEGLFDVPGLLERLWLARALEAHRERPGSSASRTADVPAASSESSPPPGAPTPTTARTVVSNAPFPGQRSSDGPTVAVASVPRSSLPPTSAPSVPIGFRPSSWVCPYCYLANDAAASTCRGCRSSSLHL